MLTCILFSYPDSTTILAFFKAAELSLESVIEASKPTKQEHRISLALDYSHCKMGIQAKIELNMQFLDLGGEKFCTQNTLLVAHFLYFK